MRKKIIKYAILIIMGLFTLFWILVAFVTTIFPKDEYLCETGKEDWTATICALIGVASFVAFCVVWYITRDKRAANSDIKSTNEDFSEPFKTYVEFINYMSELEWIKIGNEEEIASQSGLYLFCCRGDNHHFYGYYELKKGEKICKYYLDHHLDGWAVVVPESYHIVDNVERDYLMKNLNWMKN